MVRERETPATGLEDALDPQLIEALVAITMQTHTRQAAITENAKERSDTAVVNVPTAVIVATDTVHGVRESGTATEALRDATETTVLLAETEETCSMIAEVVAAVVEEVAETAASRPCSPREVPVLPRNPRSPLPT